VAYEGRSEITTTDLISPNI